MASVTYDNAHRDAESARPKPSRRRVAVWFVIVALLLALVGGGLFAFDRFRAKAIADFFASQVPPPTPVAAEPARLGPMPRYLDGIGTLTAVREVEVSPEVAGRVELEATGLTVRRARSENAARTTIPRLSKTRSATTEVGITAVPERRRAMSLALARTESALRYWKLTGTLASSLRSASASEPRPRRSMLADVASVSTAAETAARRPAATRRSGGLELAAI